MHVKQLGVLANVNLSPSSELLLELFSCCISFPDAKNPWPLQILIQTSYLNDVCGKACAVIGGNVVMALMVHSSKGSTATLGHTNLAVGCTALYKAMEMKAELCDMSLCANISMDIHCCGTVHT